MIGSIEEYLNSVKSTWPATERRLNDIRVETARDTTLQLVAEYIINGWPAREATPSKAKAYYQDPDLSIVEGIITKGNRILIPESMREEILQKLH